MTDNPRTVMGSGIPSFVVVTDNVVLDQDPARMVRISHTDSYSIVVTTNIVTNNLVSSRYVDAITKVSEAFWIRVIVTVFNENVVCNNKT